LPEKGAAETLAYLPRLRSGAAADRCSTALNDEDIGTLRLLYEAGIPRWFISAKFRPAGRRRSSSDSPYIKDGIAP